MARAWRNQGFAIELVRGGGCSCSCFQAKGGKRPSWSLKRPLFPLVPADASPWRPTDMSGPVLSALLHTGLRTGLSPGQRPFVPSSKFSTALQANTTLGSERKSPLVTARESGSPCSSWRQVPLRGLKMLQQPSSFKQIHLEFLSRQDLAQFRATLSMSNMGFGGQET